MPMSPGLVVSGGARSGDLILNTGFLNCPRKRARTSELSSRKLLRLISQGIAYTARGGNYDRSVHESGEAQTILLDPTPHPWQHDRHPIRLWDDVRVAFDSIAFRRTPRDRLACVEACC